MTINVNERVTVRLTPAGIERVKHWLTSVPIIGKEPNYAESYLDTCHPGWREGKFTTHLWELMNIFGPLMYMGAPPGPFERNEIELTERTVAQSRKRV